jgi:hypothetical protein
MHLFTLTTRNGANIRIERDVITNKVTVDKINMIKTVRNVMHCNLRDAKDFCDLFIKQLDMLASTPDAIRNEIVNSLSFLTSADDLFDVLRFVNTTIDHPKPVDPEQLFGSFDSETGYYTPKKNSGF